MAKTTKSLQEYSVSELIEYITAIDWLIQEYDIVSALYSDDEFEKLRNKKSTVVSKKRLLIEELERRVCNL